VESKETNMTNWPGGPSGGGWNDPGRPTGDGPAPYRQPWGDRPGQTSTPPGWGQQPPTAQPWGTPPPGPQPQQWGTPPGPQSPQWGAPQAGPTTGRRKSPLLIVGIVVVLVAVVGLGGYFAVRKMGIGGSSSLSAGETVKAYLQALSDGDAEKALSYGSAQPANTDLLTDSILRKQLAKLPISNIRILDSDSSMEAIGMGSVHVAVNFGDTVQDVELRVKRDDDKNWKLETAAIKIDKPYASSNNDASNTLTVFGKGFDAGSLYVFPGYTDIGSSNSYLDVTAEPLLLEALSMMGSARIDATYELNDKGTAAVDKAVADAFAPCEGAKTFAPPRCPTKVRPPSDGVDGTASWGPADLSGVDVGMFSAYDLSVSLSGEVKFPLTYRTTDGGTTTGDVTAYVSGDADVSTKPPTLDLR
jgi:hypothetical protein